MMKPRESTKDGRPVIMSGRAVRAIQRRDGRWTATLRIDGQYRARCTRDTPEAACEAVIAEYLTNDRGYPEDSNIGRLMI